MREFAEDLPRKINSELDKLVRISYKNSGQKEKLGLSLWDRANWSYELIEVDGVICLSLENDSLSFGKISQITEQFFDLLGPDYIDRGLSNFISSIKDEDEENRSLHWILSDRYYENLPIGAYGEPEHVNSISLDECFGVFSIFIKPFDGFVEFIDDIIYQIKLDLAIQAADSRKKNDM